MATINKLSDIPGVGKTKASLLLDYFKNEEAAVNAILNKKVIELSSIPGVGRTKAIRLIRAAMEKIYGTRLRDILRTDDAMMIYHKILNIIASYAKTDYTKDVLQIYFPLPSSKIDIIKHRLAYFGNARHIITQISSDILTEILSNLSKLKPLKKDIRLKRITDRIIITDDEKIYEKLQDAGYSQYITVDLITKKEMLRDYLQGYSIVFFISRHGIVTEEFSEVDNLEILDEIDETKLLPEKIIFFFSSNLDVIKAISRLAELLESYSQVGTIKDILSDVDFSNLKQMLKLLTMIDESGDIAQGANKSIDRYRRLVKELDLLIAEKELWINETIRNKIGSSNITLNGRQILSILESADNEAIDADRLKQYLPEDVTETILETIETAEESLAEELQLTDEEIHLLNGIFPRTIRLPIEAITSRVDELTEYFKQKLNTTRYYLLQNLAQKLKNLKEKVLSALQCFFELDLFLTIGRFALDYDLNIPEISNDYHGATFFNGRNLFLVQQYLDKKISEVVPVTYSVGVSPVKLEGTNDENVIIISGANSGGKTTLLQTILQIVILGQMGFPVPAKKSFIGLFDEIYYYAKAQGVLSAGAFETSLKRMAELVISKSPKLVCFDEWEASTEADAAAKIIAATLDMFYENKSTCVVFVSHLADRIRKLVKVPIRIDGIEAKGLDENLNLIVDRSPRFNYIARSMPELIVKRLAKTTTTKEREIYEKILSLFTSS